MKGKQVERLAVNFEKRTGVDLRTYRRPEITEAISDLLRFPLYAAKFVAVPLGICLLVTITLAILADGWIQSTVAAIAAPVVALIVALTGAAVPFIFRLKTDVTDALCLGLDLSREVTDDVREVQTRHQEKRLSPPSFGELVSGVMHVVIIPVTQATLKRKIPFLGRVFGGMVGWLAGLATRRLIKNVEAEHPELEGRPKEDSEDESWILKRLEDLSDLADGTKKVVSVTIDWASRVLLIPAVLIFSAAVWGAVAFYFLVFRFL